MRQERGEGESALFPPCARPVIYAVTGTHLGAWSALPPNYDVREMCFEGGNNPGCGLDRQVCAYRCITSYETEAMEAFSLCVLQKNNCMGNFAEIPALPDPAPLAQFRGSPLTLETAEDLFIGWLGKERHSWMVVSQGHERLGLAHRNTDHACACRESTGRRGAAHSYPASVPRPLVSRRPRKFPRSFPLFFAFLLFFSLLFLSSSFFSFFFAFFYFSFFF